LKINFTFVMVFSKPLEQSHNSIHHEIYQG
jgi:hypothetical protein